MLSEKTKIKLLESIVILLVASIIIFCIVAYVTGGQIYIAGKYGNKCYLKGHESKNIIYTVEFNSLIKCEEFINY